MIEKKSSWKNTEWKTPEVSEKPAASKKDKADITSEAIKVIAGKVKREDADKDVLDAAHKILIGEWF